MSGGIKIPVSAEFDSGDATQAIQQFAAQFNKLGASIGQANRVKFTPISKATLDDAKKLEASYRSLLKISGDLRSRVNSTGQQGASFLQLDWEKLFPAGPLQRNFRMQQAFEHVAGPRFSSPSGGGGGSSGGGRGGGTHGGGSLIGGVARQVAGAGLGAMGPAGRVVSGTLSGGMGGGVMAGLAGLGGGLAALAISKAVGAVVEKVGAVEAENIRHDRLKRTLGDTGVGFNALKKSIRGASGQMGVTFDEGQDLAAQYIKTAGLSNRNWRGVGDEVATAGNFGRSFGVDPTQAVGAFGTLRHFGVTGGDQDARKIALLIGEGIAKSGAFAKSEEFLQAIAGYTQQAAHAGMNAPASAAYAAMLSGMVGSKIPGMDVQGSAALLSKVDGAIRNGGVDEAGQNFMYRVLGRAGWDPVDARLQQEQGMFGAPDQTFGEGSVANRFYRKYGISTPAGAQGDSTNNYSKLIGGLEAQYSGGPEMKKLMASAFARQTGMNLTQAMAMLTVGPAELGGMGKRLGRLGIDVKDVNATGISRMAQIEGDSSLSESEKDKRIRQAATEGQEQTPGSIAKDSKAALENIKSTLADKLVPLTQGMRDGIMFLAGGSGKMSGRQIQEAMMAADSDDRKGQIKSDFDRQIRDEAGRPGAIRAERDAALADLRRDYNDPEKRAAGQARVQALSDQLARQEEESRKRVLQLQQDREAAIKKETDGLSANIKALAEEEAARRQRLEQVSTEGETGNAAQAAFVAGAGRGSINPPTVGAGRGNALAGDSTLLAELAKTDQLIGAKPGTSAAQIQQESAFNPTARSRAGAMGLAQIMPSTLRSLEKRFGRKLNPDDPSDAVLMHRELMRENVGKFGNVPDALRAYNGGWDRSKWGNAETSGYVPSIERNRERMNGTPIPDTGSGAGGRSGDQRVSVTGETTHTVVIQDPRGQQLAPTQRVSARLSSPSPAGA